MERVPLGQIVTFEVNGYRQADEVLVRSRCPRCSMSILVTSGHYRLTPDGRRLHTCDEEE